MLKKLLILMTIGFLVGCTSLDNLVGKKDGGPVREIGGEIKIEDNRIDVVAKEANNENIKEYLTMVKNNLKSSVKKVENDVKNNYTVGLGETLVFPLENEKVIKLTTSPRNTSTKINLSNGKVSFRSVYQGDYVLSTYGDSGLNRKINVKVIAKYGFSEKELYDVIVQNSRNQNKDLENVVTLYKMMFPAGKHSKEVNYLFLEYAYNTRDKSLMNEALAGIKNDFSSYSDTEKATILKVAKLVNKSIFVPAETYNTSNSELKNALQEYIGNKENFDKNDKVFIEKIKEESPEISNEIVRDKFKAVIDATAAIKAGNLSTSKAENSTESYYDKAMKNLNKNPKVAIENFKKSLSTEKIQDKKPEIYYNIASSYAKLGNKVEVTKYLRLLKQEFPNSEWEKKSEALTKLIK